MSEAVSRFTPGPQSQVDWGHPLAADLTVLCVAQGAYWHSYASGLVTQFVPVNAPRATTYGYGYDHSANAAGSANPRISGFRSHTGPATWFAAGLFTGNNTPVFKGIACVRSGTLHGLATGTEARVIDLWYNTDRRVSGPTFTETTPIAVVGSASPSSCRLRVNNTVATAAGQAAVSLSGQPLELGGDNFAAGGRPWPGTLNIVGMSLRQWSPEEEQMFISDPFCMFEAE
jgi:uncharacterized Zn-binding protein involved in type VI secretion